jgi:hypothetical protein
VQRRLHRSILTTAVIARQRSNQRNKHRTPASHLSQEQLRTVLLEQFFHFAVVGIVAARTKQRIDDARVKTGEIHAASGSRAGAGRRRRRRFLALARTDSR